MARQPRPAWQQQALVKHWQPLVKHWPPLAAVVQLQVLRHERQHYAHRVVAVHLWVLQHPVAACTRYPAAPSVYHPVAPSVYHPAAACTRYPVAHSVCQPAAPSVPQGAVSRY